MYLQKKVEPVDGNLWCLIVFLGAVSLIKWNVWVLRDLLLSKEKPSRELCLISLTIRLVCHLYSFKLPKLMHITNRLKTSIEGFSRS